MGQLIVTTFLLYSGYGIYEKIKQNKEEYINNFYKKRFLTTLVNFAFAVVLFLVLNLILQKNMELKTILLSFIGWELLGNSNWYMFVIFIIYIGVLFSFKVIKNNNKYSLILLTIISIIYIYLLTIYKSNYWCDTLICFVAGMWYSYFKKKLIILL